MELIGRGEVFYLSDFYQNIFVKNFLTRISGALSGALVFFIITNFGVWLSGTYGLTIEGLINCYVLAIPFFGYTAISYLTIFNCNRRILHI